MLESEEEVDRVAVSIPRFGSLYM